MAQASKQGKWVIGKNRWFIWTLVVIAVVLVGTATYITVVSDNDASNDQPIFLVHHTAPKPPAKTTKK